MQGVSGLDPSIEQPDRVSSDMSVAEIIGILVKHRCPDITTELDLDQCSQVPIATGGFGDVFRGALTDGTRIAIKCARLYIQQDDKNRYRILKNVARELYTWSRLEHENIVKLLGLAQHRHQIAMVSPWMDNGTLLQYLKRNPEVDRCPLMIQISNGVAYLHENDMTHGDIKSGNILVSRDGIAKLADFGCAVLKKKAETLRFTTTESSTAFSARWTAPEVLLGEVLRSTEADVYSVGMTLLEAVTGCIPFADRASDIVVIALVVGVGQIPALPMEFASLNRTQAELLWDLLQGTWAREPAERPSMKEIQSRLEHVQKHGNGPAQDQPLRSPPVSPSLSESTPPLSDDSSGALGIKDALAYLEMVKLEYQDKPDVYGQFLDIMKDFKSETLDTPGVIVRVSNLFDGHLALIQAFNTFLPRGYRIDCAVGQDGRNIITVTTPSGMTAQVMSDKAIQRANYMAKVKQRFASDPDTYNRFLQIICTKDKEDATLAEVHRQLSVLFREHQDLLDGLKYPG